MSFRVRSLVPWPSVAGVLLLSALLMGCAASEPATNGASSQQQAEAPSSPSGEEDGENGLKPFDEVIPDSARTDDGLLTTHRFKNNLYFELPDSLIGRELLMVSRAARTPDGFGYGGEKVNTQVLRWQRRGNKLYLRVVSHQNMADEEDPVYRAVQNSNLEPIIQSFSIEALNEDSTGVVFEVSDLFTSDVSSLGIPSEAREEYQVRRLDPERTYVMDVQSFPENTDVEAVLTYQAQNPPSSSSTNTLTVEMNHSMVLLPKEPRQPRLCDDRVGYFSVERVNYSSDQQKAAEECFITRWPLEPKDPEAYARGELVEPKEPIVYYIDPATPKKWRPYLMQGVESWQKAFREAGFKNAIIAKSPAEADSTFDPDDIRYSTIRYFASEVQNAYGPHVHDPRSGEILESDIGWYHNVMNLLRNWYFVQTAAVNPEARGRVFDEEVMGRLIRFVAAHEVGHTLGLPHNMGSSNAVPVDSLRSPSYMEDHGTAPSIMDYARFNYVAQPGDGVESFTPKIGVYDKWAIQWGYTERVEGSPEEQAQQLDEMILEHVDDPRYFYGEQSFGGVDPRSQTEDIGRDAMEASRLGIENLKRILPNLIEWTSKDGEGYGTLEELYGAVVNQWQRYMGHVGNHIGGIHDTPKTYDQEGPVYEPVPAERQQRAMDFLLERAFQTPRWMIEADVLRRIEHTGMLNRVREAQTGVLGMVLDPQRLARVLETEALEDGEVYTLGELLADLRGGIWAELDDGSAIDPYRRNLQRGYLEQMDALLSSEVQPPPPEFQEFIDFTPVDLSQSDIRTYVRGELQTLRDEVERALSRTSDETTRMHLDDVLGRIERILERDDDSEA